MNDDELLQRHVLEGLERDPRVNAADIGVAVRQGVVTLTGFVRSHAERLAAEQVAQGIKGVRGIALEVTVRLPGEKKRTDTDLAERALKILDWDEFVPKNRITVEVEDGVLTLRGRVDWRFEKTAAEIAVRSLSGLQGVRNAVVVMPSVAPTDIHRAIEEAFQRSAALDAARITVSAMGDTVTVGGTVSSFHEREVALEIAWSAAGVKHVDDRIVVQP